MDLPDVEYLIDRAISNRPKVTNASMNLYVFNSRVVCGARIVMPKNAALVSHLLPEQLISGFNDRQWKLLVDKTKNILENQNQDSNAVDYITGKAKQHLINDERRVESRLPYRRPIWFAEDLHEKLNRAVLCDVSSGGMSFTCCADENSPQPGEQIAARFNVPKRSGKDSVASMKFDRIGRICRIDKIDNSLNRVAVQFTTPLPFKPAQQLDNQSSDLLNVLED